MSFTKQPCYIFDLDNTLVNMNGRSPYDNDLSGDTENIPATFLFRNLNSDLDLIILSWRKESSFLVPTKEWLADHDLHYDLIELNDTNPCLPGPLFKYQKLKELMIQYDILWVFDDDQNVIDICKQLWIPSFHFSINTK